MPWNKYRNPSYDLYYVSSLATASVFMISTFLVRGECMKWRARIWIWLRTRDPITRCQDRNVVGETSLTQAALPSSIDFPEGKKDRFCA